MSLPFTVEQFFQVFAVYNQAVWPAQFALYALGVSLAALGYLGPLRASRWIAFGLAGLWGWMGAVYHWKFFREINPAASLFGGAFLLQSILFIHWGATHQQGDGGRVRRAQAWLGGTILAYGLLVYPLLGWTLGHRYPVSPTFGLPCPTTIVTFGLLVWVSPRPRWWLLVIPVLWMIVGMFAAFRLGVHEDLGLLGAGVVATGWLVLQAADKRSDAIRRRGEAVLKRA